MIRSRVLPAVAFCLGLVQSVRVIEASAQEKRKSSKDAVVAEPLLSIESVVGSTLQNHPLLSATQQERAYAEAEKLAAQGGFDRVLKSDYKQYPEGGYSGTYYNLQVEQPFETWGSKVVGGFRQSSGTFPIYDDYLNTNADGEGRVGVEVPLLRDRATDRRRTALAKADVQREIAGLSIDQRKIELVRAAAHAYWEWVASDMKRRVFERLLTVAKERDRQFQTRAKAGELAEFDRNDNLRQVFQRESQLLQAERGLQRAAYDLSLFLRAEDGSARPVVGFSAPKTIPDITPADVADALSKAEHALKARPDMKRLERIKEQQQLDMVLAQNEFLPRLDLGSYLSRDMGEGNPNRDETELQVGLRVEVPLQTRSQQGRLDLLSAKQREIEFQETALKDRIRTEVLDAINAIDIARSRVDVARKELALAKKLEEGELIKFNQGDSNLIFINVREQTTADSAVREIDTLLDFQKAIAAYHAAVGMAEISGPGSSATN